MKSERQLDELCPPLFVSDLFHTPKQTENTIDFVIKYTPIPFVWNTCEFHQFLTYWNTTNVSLNSSEITTIFILAIFESFLSTAIMIQAWPKSIIKVSRSFMCTRFHQYCFRGIPMSRTIRLSFFIIVSRSIVVTILETDTHQVSSIW